MLNVEPNPRLFPALWTAAKTAAVTHQNQIQQYLHNNHKARDELLSNLMAHFGVNTQSNEWKEHGFPLYICVQEGIIYQVDVLIGEALKNGNQFSVLADLKRQPLYKEVFGNEILVCTDTETRIDSQDKHGNIRFCVQKAGWGRSIDAIQREIDRAWVQYISPNSSHYPLLPPLPDAEHLQVWQSVDGQKTEYFIVDKRTMSPKYVVDEEGFFYFPYGAEAKRYEWVDISTVEEGEGIANFDPQAILWKPAPKSADETYPPRLVFPHYRDEQENILEFIQKEGKWVFVAIPHLHMAHKQILNGITNCSRFLVLEDKEGEQEVLLPSQTLTQIQEKKSFASSCERIKLEEGQPSSRLPAKNAYLAYLALAHAITPQDYALAMEYLKGAFSFEKYSPEELRLMGWIFNLTKEKPDHSGSMDSVRLMPLGLFRIISNAIPAKKFPFPKRRTSHIPEEGILQLIGRPIGTINGHGRKKGRTSV